MWVESYAVGEYRHGPVATCAPGTLVWGLDVVPADIVEVVESAGGRVSTVGGADGRTRATASVCRGPRHHRRPRRRHPNLLSRSVVLNAGTS